MKKNLFPTLLTGVAALAGGLMSSPSGQQLAEQTANNIQQQQVLQQTPAQRYVNQQQQAQSRTSGRAVSHYLANPYVPVGGGAYYGAGYGMSPKEYGEYLMRSGKNKYNKRHRKYWAKARA